MKVKILLNGTMREAEISSDQLLIDFVRDHGCYSVKRGCETSNCGLCTVFVDDKPVLSCSMLTARVDGCKVDTLEGLQEEAKEFGAFVEFAPGKEGMVHISKISKERINHVEDVLTLGDHVKVVCLGKDKLGRISFSMKDVAE